MFSVVGEAADFLEADLAAGKTYYIQVAPRMGAWKAAEKYYQKVIDDYMDTEFAPLATYYIADMEYKQKRYDEASKGYKGFIAVFPDHELAEKARKQAADVAYKSGEKAYDKGDYTVAKEHLESFVAGYPDHKKVNKARELLEKINGLPLTDSKGEDANS